MRPEGTAEHPPVPPLPEATGVPPETPRPTLSPRDLQPGASDLPGDEGDQDGVEFQAPPEQSPEGQPTPAEEEAAAGEADRYSFPTFDPSIEQSQEKEEAADEEAASPANPFDSSRALPTLLPGGIDSRYLRRWADRSSTDRFRGRLLAVRGREALLLLEDGSLARISLDRLSSRDAAFVELQVRAAVSTARSVHAERTQNQGGRLLATLYTLRNADAVVGVAR